MMGITLSLDPLFVVVVVLFLAAFALTGFVKTGFATPFQERYAWLMAGTAGLAFLVVLGAVASMERIRNDTARSLFAGKQTLQWDETLVRTVVAQKAEDMAGFSVDDGHVPAATTTGQQPDGVPPSNEEGKEQQSAVVHVGELGNSAGDGGGGTAGAVGAGCGYASVAVSPRVSYARVLDSRPTTASSSAARSRNGTGSTYTRDTLSWPNTALSSAARSRLGTASSSASAARRFLARRRWRIAILKVRVLARGGLPIRCYDDSPSGAAKQPPYSRRRHFALLGLVVSVSPGCKCVCARKRHVLWWQVRFHPCFALQLRRAQETMLSAVLLRQKGYVRQVRFPCARGVSHAAGTPEGMRACSALNANCIPVGHVQATFLAGASFSDVMFADQRDTTVQDYNFPLDAVNFM